MIAARRLVQAHAARARWTGSAPRCFSTTHNELLNAPREAMEYDVVIVGAGPAGLSAAIRLKQMSQSSGKEISVCVVEKAAEVGAHILSGNVFEPRALNELWPTWKEDGALGDDPTEASEDHFHFLTSATNSFKTPSILIPPTLHNHGNYVISLGQLVRWLGTKAEDLGVEIYPGFPASEVLYDENGNVKGIATADMGIDKNGKPKDTFMRGMEIHGKQTLFAEGARGSCSEDVIEKFDLRKNCDMQSYGLGIKEVWQIPEEKLEPGLIQHTLGWPLDNMTYGGSFLYHMKPNYILLGMVVGLDYQNPYLNPYEEFQRLKHHPVIKSHIEDGECIAYGARVINEGGFQAIPRLTFPGGALIGCSAGFLNVPKIKGSHTAMKSGLLAAEAIFDAVAEKQSSGEEITQYETDLKKSWLYEELKSVRNYAPSFKHGAIVGTLYSGLSGFILRGKEPWTLSKHGKMRDADATKKASECKPIEYPKPDGKISFDILTNLQRSGTNHEHDQPSHLKIKPELAHIPNEVSITQFAGPEQRFCPAKVYEYHPDENDDGKLKLVINAQNCVHCKTCSIKSVDEFIKWECPEGSGGPAYQIM